MTISGILSETPILAHYILNTSQRLTNSSFHIVVLNVADIFLWLEVQDLLHLVK